MKQLGFESLNSDIERLDDGSSLISKDMQSVLHSSMLPYAEYVIMDRAIPRVEDGLKPVQRRILYTMYTLGITPDKPTKKSARVVGECLGKYHPHGDTSVYGAMVRMAQDFNNNIPLIEGQGNFGSIDGDDAAAMRYTEVRLSELSMELLKDIEKNTVRWSRNFDDSTKEPDILPGRFPNLLVNGASGIAVGLATNIPPHNLGEVINGVIALMDNKNIKLSAIMKFIPGPDFPTGGYVIGGDGLLEAYETGRGKIFIRCRCHIEKADNGREQIVITEIPYGVNKSAMLMGINKLREDKKEIFAGISEIVDESDKEGIRAVIKVKKDFTAKDLLAPLFKYSDMQVTFGINMVAIADGKPQQMGLLDVLAYYINYQKAVVLNRTKFELEEARERMHILEGLVIAVTNIDQVIEIIKKSASVTDAKQKLRLTFSLSDRQAQAILDLRLARLTKLEITKLQQELEALTRLVERLTAIVHSSKLLSEVVKEELIAVKKAYRQDRQSNVIESADFAQVKVHSNEIPVENTVLCITTDGKIKRMSPRNYGGTNKNLIDTSNLYQQPSQVLYTMTNNKAVFITNLGNFYRIDVGKIKEVKFRDDAQTISEVFAQAETKEKVIKMYQLPNEGMPEGDLVMYTQAGLIKRTNWSEYGLLKASYSGYKGKEGDDIIGVEQLRPGATVLYVTESGMCLNFSMDEVPIQGRISGGVKGMQIAENDKLVFAGQLDADSYADIITNKGYAKRVSAKELGVMTRYRKGVKIIELAGANGTKVLFASTGTAPYSIALCDPASTVLIVNTDIQIESRTSKGKLLKAKGKASNLHTACRFTFEQD